MQINNAGNIGIAGEFRCVVTKADGTIKEDTGFQKNLILNQGLDFFGGDNGRYINNSCAIGSGNSAPTVTQTGLDAYIKQVGGTDVTSDYSYADEGDNLYRMWEQKKYRFTGLNNVNISEVGLVSNGTSASNYYLTTRALIKDTEGNPTTITVKSDETLDIYYKIHKVIDVTDKSFVVNMLDGDGGAVPYNVVIRPSHLGNSQYNSVTEILNIHSGGSSGASYTYLMVSPSDLAHYTTAPSGGERINLQSGNPVRFGTYIPGTYKRVVTIYLGLDSGNVDNILTLFTLGSSSFGYAPFKFLPFQIRFGSVADDSPINKTNKETLTLPFEVSWGRYEGEL